MVLRLALSFLPVLCLAQAIAPKQPVQLFNGKDLTGWYTYLRDSKLEDPKRVFSVGNGELRISGEEWGGVATRDSYRDYHLIVEWKWGGKTWGNREKRARDSGILVHARGEDGAAGGTWLASIESQIIEGGTGDMILVAGKDERPTVTAKVRQSGKETYFDPNGQSATMDRGRIDWWGRSPEWRDEVGFRGSQDVEHAVGEWNRQEIFCEGNKLRFVLNGKLVNEAYDSTWTDGKIQIQSEGAEIIIRKVEIRPVQAGRK